MTDQILLQLQLMPDNLKKEVLDFIGYLLSKHQSPDNNPQPSRKKHFGKYRGSLKTGLSLPEIDAQLRQGQPRAPFNE
jgi:hypothetical protein